MKDMWTIPTGQGLSVEVDFGITICYEGKEKVTAASLHITGSISSSLFTVEKYTHCSWQSRWMTPCTESYSVCFLPSFFSSASFYLTVKLILLNALLTWYFITFSFVQFDTECVDFKITKSCESTDKLRLRYRKWRIHVLELDLLKGLNVSICWPLLLWVLQLEFLICVLWLPHLNVSLYCGKDLVYQELTTHLRHLSCCYI